MGWHRREKGRKKLAGLVKDMWPDLLNTGKIQLLIQCKRSRLKRLLPRAYAWHVQCHRSGPQRVDETLRGPLVHVPHPLPMDDYANLIRTSDIGIFPCDSTRYYARCSGVLVEMLSAGVPVVVPAGCWLAEQIAESNYQHVDQVRTSIGRVKLISARNLFWQDGSGARIFVQDELTFTGPANAATCTLQIPPEASGFTTALDRGRTSPGKYIRVRTEQMDDAGRRLGDFSTTVGHRPSGLAVPLLVSRHRNAQRMRVTFQNAYHQTPVSVRDLQIAFLPRADTATGFYPAGAVGLIADGPLQIPDRVREIAQHSEHYLRTAAEFSRQWSHDHNPQRTVAVLQEMSRRRAAGTHRHAA